MLLQVQGLTKGLGNQDILRSLDLSVEAGEAAAVMGPNGAGKTTLLNVIAGLLVPDGGKVLVQGVNPFEHVKARRHIGFIPVDGFAYDHLNAVENLEMLLSLYQVKKSRSHILEVLDEVGLSEADVRKSVGTYSSGMKQKLTFASGVIHQPQLLMLDEPFNALDLGATRRFQSLLHSLLQQGRGILFTSHLPETILPLANRVLLLNEGTMVDELQLDDRVDVPYLQEWYHKRTALITQESQYG
ncbi:ABC transporter ATP-binding protein [Salinithrix halophila]|uniref:ABC transporter ATP-binding protein n=1 Tax=Salinithrix halophila TaxID=1485204 RepID=A0ABV8JFY5_9BACL